MGKIRHNKKNNFTMIDNTIVKDDTLTWKARGIFAYLWAMPDDWDFYMNEVAKHSRDGRVALQSGIKELEEHGYLRRTMEHGKDGKMTAMYWELSDTAEYRKADNALNVETVKRKTCLTGNLPLLNKNNTKEKNKLNKNNTNHNNSIDTNKNELSGCGCVFEFFEKNVGMLSPFLREDIQYEYSDWLELNEKEAGAILIKAMEIAVAAQAKQKWRYAKAILKSWKERNIHTLKAIKLDNEKSSKTRKSIKPKDTNRKYHF